MSEVEPAEIRLHDLPRCLVAADDAFRSFIVKEHRFGCSHVIHGQEELAVILCVRHPIFGVMCGACMIDHAERHQAFADTACDECGTVGGVGGFAIQAQPAPFVVRDTSDLSRLIRGPISLFPVVLCRACWRRAAL